MTAPEIGGLLPGEHLKGSGLTVWTEGSVLVIKYGVLFYGFLGTKRVPVSNITSVTWNEPGGMISGWLDLSILGERRPSPAASPNVQNQNRLKFDRPEREGFARLRDWIEARIVRAPAASGGPSVADEIAKLGDLLSKGLLTTEEFAQQKAKLLG